MSFRTCQWLMPSLDTIDIHQNLMHPKWIRHLIIRQLKAWTFFNCCSCAHWMWLGHISNWDTVTQLNILQPSIKTILQYYVSNINIVSQLSKLTNEMKVS